MEFLHKESNNSTVSTQSNMSDSCVCMDGCGVTIFMMRIVCLLAITHEHPFFTSL